MNTIRIIQTVLSKTKRMAAQARMNAAAKEWTKRHKATEQNERNWITITCPDCITVVWYFGVISHTFPQYTINNRKQTENVHESRVCSYSFWHCLMRDNGWQHAVYSIFGIIWMRRILTFNIEQKNTRKNAIHIILYCRSYIHLSFTQNYHIHCVQFFVVFM